MAEIRVLIVEDEAITRLYLVDTAKRFGYRVTGDLSRGEDVLDAVRTQQPDVVLMDIKLAGPMDGIAAANLLRREAETAVVFLTAHGDLETVRRAAESEPFGYVLKPIDERELTVNIELAYCRGKVATYRRRYHEMIDQFRDSERMQRELVKKAEEERFANRILTEFLNILSHDLRTPINQIVGICDLIKTDPEVMRNPAVVEWSDKLSVAGWRLSHYITDLLDLAESRLGRLKVVPQPVRLGPIVADVVAVLRPVAEVYGGKIELSTDDAISKTMVRADPNRLRQIIVSLISRTVLEGGQDRYIKVIVDHSETAQAIVRFEGVSDPPWSDFLKNQSIYSALPEFALSLDLIERMDGTLDRFETPGFGWGYRLVLPTITRADHHPE